MRILSLTMLTLTACAATAGLWLGMESQTSAQNPGNPKAEAESPDGTIRAAGTLNGADSVAFHCLLPGQSTILSLVPDGANVQKGDVLVEFDSSQLEQRIGQQRIVAAKADSDSAATLAELEITKLQADAATAEMKAALSQQGIESGLDNLELEAGALEKRLSTLSKKTALVRKQQETRVESVREGLDYNLMLLDFETETQIAKQKLEHLKTKVIPKQQELNDRQIKAIEHKLLVQKLKSQSDIQAAEAAFKSRKLIEDAEQERLTALQQHLDNCKIVAPRDGIVVYANQASRRVTRIVIEEGATVRERQLVLTMPDLEHLQMNVRVHESKIARIKQGQSATVTFDALPDQKFQGTVTSIADLPFPGVGPNVDNREYEVIVSLKQPDPKLKFGLTGIVEIDVSK